VVLLGTLAVATHLPAKKREKKDEKKEKKAKEERKKAGSFRQCQA
jgi:hypothetical protein